MYQVSTLTTSRPLQLKFRRQCSMKHAPDDQRPLLVVFADLAYIRESIFQRLHPVGGRTAVL